MINPHEKISLETAPVNPHSETPYNEDVPDSATLSEPPVAATPAAVSITDIAGQFHIDLGDGTPTVPTNRDGTPKRKPGRPRKVTDAVPVDPTSPQAVTQPAAPKSPATKKANRVASDELARAILHLSVGGLSAIVGPEWNFQSSEEAAGMKAAVSAYIESKGDGQLSPEALLALVVASYAVPRFAEENTRSKLGGFFGKIWDGFKGLWKR